MTPARTRTAVQVIAPAMLALFALLLAVAAAASARGAPERKWALREAASQGTQV